MVGELQTGGTAPLGMGGFELAVLVGMGAIGVVFLVLVAYSATRIVRTNRTLKRAGIDPLAAEAHLLAHLTSGSSRSGGSSLEERLDEIEALHRSGKITFDERDAARTRLLGGS